MTTPAAAALNERRADRDATHDRDRVFAPCYAGLTPRMLLPTATAAGLPFPFTDSHARYFYLARNAVYALARLWKLQGKEVLFPAYFHGVELEALLQADVRVRFYPVRKGMQVQVDDVVSRIGPDTRAIYLIHYVGFPGPVEELAQVTRDRGLLLIEDCALSLLSCLGERPLGSWGDAAIFCLYKSVPVPNGGVLVLRNGESSAVPEGDLPSRASTLALSADALERHLQAHGRRWQRAVLNAVRAVGKRTSRLLGGRRVDVDTEHFEQAYAPLAMSKLSHRIIAGQDFPAIVDTRRRNYQQLLDSLGDIAPPVFDALPTGVCPLFYPLRVRNKPAVVARFLARGVEAVNVWSRSHPGGPVEPYPDVNELRDTVLELPCHQDLTPPVIERVVRVARDLLAN
jgi:dTDP-4-amino-4,6-dideoxygalactose transaminase